MTATSHRRRHRRRHPHPVRRAVLWVAAVPAALIFLFGLLGVIVLVVTL